MHCPFCSRHIAPGMHAVRVANLCRLVSIHTHQPHVKTVPSPNHDTERCDFACAPGSRPTAVNLRIAADGMSDIAAREAAVPGASAVSVTLAVITAADAMLKEDIAANKVRWPPWYICFCEDHFIHVPACCTPTLQTIRRHCEPYVVEMLGI